MSSVGEEFPKEQKRVRELQTEYLGLPNNAGALGAALMGIALDRAERAASSGDVILILQSYEDLKGFTG